MALGIGSSTCFRIASSGVDINGADSSLLGISKKLEKNEVKDVIFSGIQISFRCHIISSIVYLLYMKYLTVDEILKWTLLESCQSNYVHYPQDHLE